MLRTAGACLVALATLACDPPPTPDGGVPANPPQVFLTVTEPNVIGDAVHGKVNVSGCKKVAGVEILQQTGRLLTLENVNGPTDFTLPAGSFSTLYPQLGIAAALTLKAKVTCDDGRTNTSQPVGVSFFPIAQRFKASDGNMVVPDQFIAEGGFGGNPTTFLGCTPTDQGATVVRVDTAGTLLDMVDPSRVFACSLNAQISERSAVTNYRWVFEPNVGAYAIENSTLDLGNEIRNSKTQRMGVGSKGTAVFWINETGTQNRIEARSPSGTVTNWSAKLAPDCIVNADPLVDEVANVVWISCWEFNMGSGMRYADIVPHKFKLTDDGQLPAAGTLLNAIMNGAPAVLLRQQYPLNEISEPIIPQGFFSVDGRTFVFPSYLVDTQQITNTVILSCSTDPGLCEGSTQRRWATVNIPGMLRMVVPYSSGNIYAAIGPWSVYFLGAQLGNVINLGGQPLRPSGTQLVVGAQPGGGADFYVLTGPNLGDGVPSYATEIIAVDTPQAGELWRLNWGSGESSGNAMYIGLDANNQTWVRVGTDLVKPLSLTEYRTARGATVLP